MASLKVVLDKAVVAEPLTRIQDMTAYEDAQRLDYASYFFLHLVEYKGLKPIPVPTNTRQTDSKWDFADLPSGHYKAELVLVPVWQRMAAKALAGSNITVGTLTSYSGRLWRAINSVPYLVAGVPRPTPDSDPTVWKEVTWIENAGNLYSEAQLPLNGFETVLYGSFEWLRFVAVGQAYSRAMFEYEECCEDCGSEEFDRVLRLRNKYEALVLANNAKAYSTGQKIIESIRTLGICSC